MKKFFAIALVAASFTACSDNTHTNESTTDTTVVAPPVETVPVDTAAVTAPVDSAVVK